MSIAKAIVANLWVIKKKESGVIKEKKIRQISTFILENIIKHSWSL